MLGGQGIANTVDDTSESACRLRLVSIAEHELGVREGSGHNDGERVESYLAYAGLKKGDPWCAAFISWIFAREGFAKPRSGWSPDLFPSSRLARSALPADVIGIYFEDKKRIAHVGLIEKIKGDWCFSIEGNTNISGSIEGDGVYRRRRILKTIHSISDWVKNGRRVP
ncbi:peptidoglycan-binding protein [Pedobacter sp. L105]|uniref:peptidoglycan-binding protein n=1 Tax=Pedobacter sp. L105 TaxID=1641871 RepID=UPI0020B1407A|nr:peptidoglycan-binding protein [Pedobacter sp. L105]